MALLDIFRSAPEIEERSLTVDSVPSIFSNNTGSYVSSLNTLTTAYSCIRLLSYSIAQTPLKHLEITDKGEKELKTSSLTNLLRRPSLNVSYFQAMQSMVTDFVSRGNGFGWIIRNSGSPSEIIYLPEASVSIYTTSTSSIPYYYQVIHNGISFKVFAEDMIHLRNITTDGYTGLSPLALHRVTFDATASMSDYNKTYMDNSANIRGTLETDKKLQPQTMKDIKEGFGDNFGGVNNAGKTPVLTEGLKYKQIQVISPMDADYINNKKMNKADISEIFGVPLTMLGDVSATYSNAEQLALIYQRYTLSPLYEMIAQEISIKLIPKHNSTKQKLEFTPDTLKLASSKERAETVSLLKNSGIITPNEGREYYGKMKLPGGDELQKEESKVGEEVQAPKNTEKTNPEPGTPKTDSNSKTTNMSKRSEEDSKEIQRLKSELGRLKNELQTK